MDQEQNLQQLIDISLNNNGSTGKEYIQTLIKNGIKLNAKQKLRAKQYGFLENMAGQDMAKSALKKNGYNLAELLLNNPEYAKIEEELIKYCHRHTITKKYTTKKAGVEKTINEERKTLQPQFNSMFIEKIEEPDTDEDQLLVLQDLNKCHHINFHQFLLDSSKSDKKFILNIVRVMEEEKNQDNQLRLFHGLCSLYKDYELPIPGHLYEPMLNYLATKSQVLAKHACGFLRLCFKNGLCLSLLCPDSAIKKFDATFNEQFDYFFQKLKGVDEYSQLIFENLPHTCLILSTPMIYALKNTAIFYGIDADHLKSMLAILTYSFPTDMKQFKRLLKKLKTTTMSSIDSIKSTEFSCLLEELALRLSQKDQKWYRKYEIVYELLVGVLDLIETNKAPKIFDKTAINGLLDGSKGIEHYINQPAHHSQDNSDFALQQLIEEIKLCNTHKTFTEIEPTLNSNCPIDQVNLFTDVGIDLLLIQQMFSKVHNNYKQSFLCTGAGAGKTTYLCGLAVALRRKTKENIIFLNANPNLLYRDCERIEKWIELYGLGNITVGVYTNGEKLKQITFMSPQLLSKIQLPEHYHIVFDEAQCLLNLKSIKLLPALEKADSFLGVTGSPVTNLHKQIYQLLLPGSLVAQFPDLYKFNSID